jgi:hypothetical protein
MKAHPQEIRLTTTPEPPKGSETAPPARPDWALVRELFGAALELPAAQRAAFVAASAAPAEARAEVLSLLMHATAEGDIGTAPALQNEGGVAAGDGAPLGASGG